MGLKEILDESPHLTIDGFQRLQSEYDDRFIAGDFSGFRKIEHTYAHIGKLMGRLAEYVHDMQEGKEVSAEELKTKVIPDLLVYSAWLAKEFGINIENPYYFISLLQEELGENYPKTKRGINYLIKCGVIRLYTKHKRNKIYVAMDILRTMEEEII